MNKFIHTLALSVFIVLSGICAHAAQRWCAVTESALIVLDDIDFLLGTDDSPYFSVILKNGGIISNVTAMSFEMREMPGDASVNDITSDQKIIVMKDIIRISQSSHDDIVRIVGLDGREFISTKVINGGSDIDISGIDPGVYILNFGDKSIKFLKQ